MTDVWSFFEAALHTLERNPPVVECCLHRATEQTWRRLGGWGVPRKGLYSRNTAANGTPRAAPEATFWPGRTEKVRPQVKPIVPKAKSISKGSADGDSGEETSDSIPFHQG